METQKTFDNKQLFYKLIRLHRWDEQRRESAAAARVGAAAGEDAGALRAVESLAADREGFARLMREAEGRLAAPVEKGSAGAAGAKEESAPTAAGSESAKGQGEGGEKEKEGADEKEGAAEPPAELKRLEALLEGSPLLREIFAAEPLFSAADPRTVETLARFADVTPDGQSMLNTQDAVFMGVLEAVQGPALAYASPMPGDEISWAAALLFAEHLGKSLAVQTADEAAAERMAALPTEHWQAVLSSLEDGRDYTDGPQSEAGKLLRELQQQTPPELQAGFGRPPRMSQIEPRLFRLAWEKRREIGELVLQRVPRDAPLGTAQAAYFRPAGIEARDLLINEVEGGAGPVKDFAGALRLRFEMARHLVGVRKDAKVETLIYKWPQAARLALANRTSIINVESYLLQQSVTQSAPNFTTEEERELYKLAQEDELFARLLRTQPYFSEIALFKYLSAAPLPPVTLPATTPPAPPPSPPAPPTPPTETTTATPEPAAQTPADDYDTYVFKVEPVGPSGGSDPNVWQWHAGFYQDGGIISQMVTVEINDSKLRKEVFESVVGVLGESYDPQPLLSRMFSRADREYLFKVVQAGETLFKTFFGSFSEMLINSRRASDALLNTRLAKLATGAGMKTRVAVVADTTLTGFPWEWLTLPGEDDNFVLNENHSLVRFLPSPGPVLAGRPERFFAKRLTPPLRVLIVMPSYDSGLTDEVDRQAALLEEELSQRGVMTRRMTGFGLTLDGLRGAVNDFIPHVLHFEGAFGLGTMGAGPNEPSLLLPAPLTAGQLKKELSAAGLQLLVLRNGRSSIYSPEVVNEILEGLVGTVIPAALAPVRAMDDGPGYEFVRSFYRALCDGRQVEEAVARARMELLSKGGDWSAYALFAHLPTLQSSRLLPPPAPTS